MVCTNDKYLKDPVVYRGENAVEHFLNSMMPEFESIKAIMANNEPLRINQETETAFKDATKCRKFLKPFDAQTVKVRDHYHIGVTGD